MKLYRVILPFDVDGVLFHYGQIAEMDEETAADYAHALIAVEQRKEEEEA